MEIEEEKNNMEKQLTVLEKGIYAKVVALKLIKKKMENELAEEEEEEEKDEDDDEGEDD